MKDQYVGDVSDFLKYALLRALSDDRDFPASVIWMRTNDDGRGDGQKLGYLSQPSRHRELDPQLFDSLAAMVSQGSRSLGAIEHAGLLPGAEYMSEVLSDELRQRQRYFERARALSISRPLVFFDPDNGLEVSSVSKGQRMSSKYLYWDEVQETFARGQSVIVYQHFPRVERQSFVVKIANIAMKLTGAPSVLGLATSHVLFAVFPQRAHERLVSRRLGRFARRAAAHVQLRAYTRS